MRRRPWLDAGPGLAVLAGSLGVLVYLVRTFAARWGYPYDLEWIEGGILVAVLRHREGLPAYPAPSAEFVPSLYPPFYPWFLALLGEPSYALGRAVSGLASLGAATAAALALRAEKLSWYAAIGGAALFLTTYEDCGTFFDIVRVDAFGLAWLAAALAVARGGTPRRVVLGGLLLAGAFAAKQSLAVFGLPIAAWLWLHRGPRRAILFGLAAATPAAALSLALQWSSGGWYWKYLVQVPRAHPLVLERAWPGTLLELFAALPWAIVAAAALAAWNARARSRGRPGEGAQYWIVVTLAAIPATALMRAHFGSFTNVLMPGLWAVSLLAALALGRALDRRPSRAVAWIAAAALCVQYLTGAWDLRAVAPTEDDRRTGAQLIEAIARAPGDVFMPHAPFYPYLAGKRPSFTLTALWDLQHPGGVLRQDPDVVRLAVAAHRWDAIALPLGPVPGLDVAGDYAPAGKLPPLETRVGWPVRFGVLWLPQSGTSRTTSPGSPAAGAGTNPERR